MLVDKSLARGAARFALNELASETNAAVQALRTPHFLGRSRAARLSGIRRFRQLLEPVALRIAHTNEIGYGGALAALLFGARTQNRAEIQLGVTLGTRGGSLMRDFEG